MELDLWGYFALFLATLKQALAYKVDFILSSISTIGQPLVMLAVWTAVYYSSNAASIGGFTLSVTVSYFFLVALSTTLINSDIDSYIDQDIRNGTIASAFVKPLRYPFQAFAQSFSVEILSVVAVGVPLLVVILLITHIAPTTTEMLLFPVEVVIGLVIMNLIAFFIGTISIYTTSIDGLSSILWGAFFLLAGGSIPLNFFPATIGNLLLLLPFPMLAYTPTVTLLGAASIPTIMSSIEVSVIWIIILLPLTYLWWNRTCKKVGSAGG